MVPAVKPFEPITGGITVYLLQELKIAFYRKIQLLTLNKWFKTDVYVDRLLNETSNTVLKSMNGGGMIFRSARQTNDLNLLIEFYTKILGLEKLGEFKGHDGYDGVFLGRHNSDWHLEFTKSLIPVSNKFNNDDIYIFYPEDVIEYEEIIKRISYFQIERCNSENPYWRKNGIMIKDPDGYNIVISNQKLRKTIA